MKKLSVLFGIMLFTATISYAQVAINKDGSQPDTNSILHVKGDASQKNILIEPGTGGKVGIGTTNPTATLDVEGDLRINDGSQGGNKVLVSDPDGKASWKKITDVSAGLMSPDFPNGLEGIVPKAIAVSSSKSFTVPNKVSFYILNVYSANSNSLQIDGMPFTFGKYNYWDGTHPVAHLDQPLIVGTGSVISGSDANEIYINGYLVGNGTGGGDPAWACGDLLVDDRDGQAYSTVQIGTQCWMAQNLNVGTMINGSNDQTDNSTIEKYCYGNDASNCTTYGGLYLWNEAMQYVTTAGAQGICPTGWHIPTDDEWKTLEMYLGMSQASADSIGYRGTDEGSKMAGNEPLWLNGALDQDANFGASGFDAIPGGYRHSGGSFSQRWGMVVFWYSGNPGGERYIYFNLKKVGRYNNVPQGYGRSVRCIRD